MLIREKSISPFFSSFLCSHFILLPQWLQHRVETADSSPLFCVQQSSVYSSISPKAVIYAVRNIHTVTTLQRDKPASIWLSFFFCPLETSSVSAACVFWWRGVFWRMDRYRLAVRLPSPGWAHGQHTSLCRLHTHYHAPGCGEETLSVCCAEIHFLHGHPHILNRTSSELCMNRLNLAACLNIAPF